MGAPQEIYKEINHLRPDVAGQTGYRTDGLPSVLLRSRIIPTDILALINPTPNSVLTVGLQYEHPATGLISLMNSDTTDGKRVVEFHFGENFKLEAVALQEGLKPPLKMFNRDNLLQETTVISLLTALRDDLAQAREGFIDTVITERTLYMANIRDQICADAAAEIERLVGEFVRVLPSIGHSLLAEKRTVSMVSDFFIPSDSERARRPVINIMTDIPITDDTTASLQSPPKSPMLLGARYIKDAGEVTGRYEVTYSSFRLVLSSVPGTDSAFRNSGTINRGMEIYFAEYLAGNHDVLTGHTTLIHLHNDKFPGGPIFQKEDSEVVVAVEA